MKTVLTLVTLIVSFFVLSCSDSNQVNTADNNQITLSGDWNVTCAVYAEKPMPLRLEIISANELRIASNMTFIGEFSNQNRKFKGDMQYDSINTYTQEYEMTSDNEFTGYFSMVTRATGKDPVHQYFPMTGKRK